MKKYIKDTLDEASLALDALSRNQAAIDAISNAASALVRCFSAGGRVFSCGNGGSMCDAMHFAEELSGRYRLDRRALPASAMSDPGHLTCVGNDYGYSQIFSRYLEAHATPGDCLLAISTSGKSENVLAAARYANENGITVIGLTGVNGSPIGKISDIEICTPAGRYADRVQELHIKVIHLLIELIEREIFPENYP